MNNNNYVLVIDDRPEDGEAIVRRLWKEQIPALFHNFDQSLDYGDFGKPHSGIRIIFQDILLVPGKGTPNHQDYGAALTILESLIAETNGPWLMIAWSTWADDNDEGDKYAKELFEYLQKRLSDGKKPYGFTVLDKTPYTIDGQRVWGQNKNLCIGYD